LAIHAYHETDPAHELRRKVGSLDWLDLFHNQVLVAIYFRPEKTKGGIVLPHMTRREDEFQGKIGLVLKLGPAAFRDDANFQFHGVSVAVGDWVVYRTSDGWELDVNGTLCRILPDTLIKARVTAPDLVF
jgi:co-chaperonin GroES (HSP10)